MWWYNILGDNKGSMSNFLRLDNITSGYILLTAKLVSLKRENSEPILTVKIIEWRKFVDYFCRSIEADPSSVSKRKIYFVYIEYIPRPSSVNLHISRHHLNKDFISRPEDRNVI